MNEEYAIVLDYLPKGKAHAFKQEPIAQVIGTDYFTLLEVVPKRELKIQEKVYIGKEKREAIERVKRRISYKQLTANAQAELEKAIETIVEEKKDKFLKFYNESVAITIKLHQLELLPGLGKKHLMDILAEREKKPFSSFEDISTRVKLMPDPKKAIVKRIVMELQGENVKYYLFVRPFKPRPRFGYRRV